MENEPRQEKKIVFRDDVTVDLVDSMASDLSVVKAAKVSTIGEGSIQEIDANNSAGLINYLMRDRHGTPFEHNSMTFYVEAPIFVWREHMRHRIASYNEESGRYRQLKPTFYIPNANRNLVQEGKPGAYTFVPGTEEMYDSLAEGQKRICTESYNEYNKQLKAGVAREVARMILPLSIYSTAYVTMNARSMMNFLSLRTKSDDSHFPSFPQREIEMVAERYEEEFAKLMPITHGTFVKNGRVAP